MVLDCHACVDGTTSDGKTCGLCGGDGEIDLEDHAFRRIKYGPMRNLTGIVWSKLLVPTNVFRSYVVLEELDATEHNALTDAQKDGILHILSCGFVDLRDGKAGKTRLWNWFGAESTTVANLTSILV